MGVKTVNVNVNFDFGVGASGVEVGSNVDEHRGRLPNFSIKPQPTHLPNSKLKLTLTVRTEGGSDFGYEGADCRQPPNLSSSYPIFQLLRDMGWKKISKILTLIFRITLKTG